MSDFALKENPMNYLLKKAQQTTDRNK